MSSHWNLAVTVSVPASNSDLNRSPDEESPAGKPAGLFFFRGLSGGLFAGYAVTISIKVAAIAALATIYRCRSSRSGCSTIGIIVPCARRPNWLRRGAATAVAVSAAIFTIIMTTVGRRPAPMRCSFAKGNYRERQCQDDNAVNGHPMRIGRKGQISMKVITANRGRHDFEVKQSCQYPKQIALVVRLALACNAGGCGLRSPRSTFIRRNGAEYPTRTDDLPLTRRLLYQLS